MTQHLLAPKDTLNQRALRYVVETSTFERPVTSKVVATAIGADHNIVSFTLKKLVDKGLLQRTAGRHSITNTPVYSYWYDAEQVKKPEKPAPVIRVKRARKLEAPQATPSPGEVRNSNPLDALLAGLQDQLSQVAVQLAEQFRQRLATEVEKQISALSLPVTLPALPAPAASRATEAPRAEPLPKIGILGLLPQQAGMIQKEYGDRFDLAFLERNHSKGLKVAGATNRKVFVMASFVGHSDTDALQACGANFKLVHGGMSSLREALTKEGELK